ncbi:sporulation protein YqfD [Clostridium polyendosporum]|uniref:Sporulation protein YqfD n=1 Tax=Clostridium polyendosporum TaxID=69208 RepID=A0A919RXA6_9CLOT|nr:sporulation protein YqfD [Clostridium polyendosporum]GIM28071.1 sporulation protein YqfD [Clostridium polyendosporum]
MDLKKYKKGTVKIEVKALIPEKFINMLWHRGIKAENIQRTDISTVTMDILLSDYRKINEIAKRVDAKITVIGRKGIAFLLLRIKKKSTLVLGAILFLAVLFYLSMYIWGIEITTNKYVSPYEVRQQLKLLGISPGIKKTKLNVYELEKKLEDGNGEIMWIRARIEGSTLKIKVEEKINPPNIKENVDSNNVVAKMDGEVVRIYTTAGTPAVKPGEIVKKGQVLVHGYEGKEGFEYNVNPEGKVLANTFYEKVMELQVSGKISERTGNKDEAIYVELWGKKIYLKKPTKSFKDYDKIENRDKILNKTTYYEIISKEITESREKKIENAIDGLYKSVMLEVDKQCKFIKKIVNIEELGEGKIRIKAVFVIEQDISTKI